MRLSQGEGNGTGHTTNTLLICCNSVILSVQQFCNQFTINSSRHETNNKVIN